MALDPIVWALKDAPVKDAGERLILTILAEHSDEDGTSAYPSQKTIAGYAMLTDRSVRDKLKALEARGILVRGDQRLVAHFPGDKRPVVWDLAIPFTWWGVRWDRMNRSRTTRGLRPLQPEQRPDLAAVDGKGNDAQDHKPRRAATGTEFRPEGGSGRKEVPLRPELSSGGGRNQVPTTLPLYPPLNPPLSLDDASGAAEPSDGHQALIQASQAPLASAPVDDFDRFWSVWPKKSGKDAARRAWKAATKRDAAEAIIAAAKTLGEHRLCPRPSDPGMRFVPDPSTWLNRAGWADEYPVWRRWEDDEADHRARSAGRPSGFVAASDSDRAALEAQLEAAWGDDRVAQGVRR